MDKNLNIAVIIPCYNEANSIASVIASFSQYLPTASVYVYDNNSTDGTADIAQQAGAIVRYEPQQGKGHVVRRMFSDIDASLYILVDGDDTYDTASAPAMVELLLEKRCDMVNGIRVADYETAYRFGHRFGNRMFTKIVNWLFGDRSSDILSGYRVFSRRFVKSFPALSTGFEIETEFTIHALSLSMPIEELSARYRDRGEDSPSKLDTYRDGSRILFKILVLTKEVKPFFFFTMGFLLLSVMSLVLGFPLILEWMETGLVPRLPTAVLSASLMLLAFLSMTTGLILDSVARGRKEAKRLHYLNLPWLDKDYSG